MDLPLLMYLALCGYIMILMVDSITQKWPRYTIADNLKFLLLVSVMLALGRVVAFL